MIRIIVLGVIAVAVLSLFVLFRSLQGQVDDLRTEVALARIEGVLGGDQASAGQPPTGAPHRRMPGLGVFAGAAIGALTTAAAWLTLG